MDAKVPLNISYVKSIIIQTDSNTIIISEPDEVEICSEPLYQYILYNRDKLQFEITGILDPEQVKVLET